MENKFNEVMSQRTDDELIKIITVERERYNPIEIEAAESEIKKRNIDTNRFEEIKKASSLEKKEEEKVKSNIFSLGKKFKKLLIEFLFDFFYFN